MKQYIKGFDYFLPILVLLGLTLLNFLVQIGVDPSYKNMSTDSGTFAYCGQVIHNGGLMYRDCWDNKPPGVYYLNAAAIALGGANPFAIWLFQAIWFTLCLWAYFLILGKIWGKRFAALSAFMLLFVFLSPDIFQGGNFTETYAVLPIVLAMGAYWAYLRTGKKIWVAGLGLLLAFSFLLKPTYISTAGSAWIIILYLDNSRRQYKTLLVHLGLFSLCAIIPVALVGVYWLIQHNLYELWFAAFVHNITYVQNGFSLRSLYGTVRLFLFNQPIASVTVLVIVTFGIYIFRNFRSLLLHKSTSPEYSSFLIPGKMSFRQSQVWWLAGIGLALIVDVLFLASSGKNFGHYLQLLLPGMVASLLYLLDMLWNSVRSDHQHRFLQAAAILGICAVLVPSGIKIIQRETPNLQELRTFFSTTDLKVYQPNQLEQYIIDHSQPNNSVLIWAGHPSMNFLTQRRSPTRYIFLQHLFTPTPYDQNGFSAFLNELNMDPPALIVAQPLSSAGLPYFENPTDFLSARYTSNIQSKMLEFKQFIDKNYHPTKTIWDWVIYQHN